MWLGSDLVVKLMVGFDSSMYLLYLNTQTYQSIKTRVTSWFLLMKLLYFTCKPAFSMFLL